MQKILIFYLLCCVNVWAQERQQTNVQIQEQASQIVLTAEEYAWLDAHPDIQLGISNNFKPAFLRDENGNFSGVLVDYLELINSRLNTNINFYFEEPWSVVTQKAIKRDIDGLAISAPNLMWDKYFLYTEPLYNGYFYVFVREGEKLEESGLAAFRGKKVGYLKGTRRLEEFFKQEPEIRLVALDNFTAMVQALLKNEVDVLVNSIYLDWWRKQNAQTAFKIGGIIEESRFDIVMSIRNDWPQLRDIINKALASISAETHAQINERWFGRDLADLKRNSWHLTPQERAYLARIRPRQAKTNEWMPFSFQDENGETIGMAMDYWQLITAKLGLQTEIVGNMPFAYMLRDMQNEELDLIIHTSQTAERERYADFSKPYDNFPLAFATRKNTGFITNTAALEGQVVAVGENYTAHQLLKKQYPNISLLPVSNTREALQRVAKGEAYAAVDILPVLQYQLDYLADNKLRFAGVSELMVPLQIMVHKSYAVLVPFLDRAIDAITPQERINIQRKWMTRQVVSITDYSLLWIVSSVLMLILGMTLYWNHSLARSRTALKRSENFVRATLDSMAEHLCVLSGDGAILMVNRAWLEFGMQNGALQSRFAEGTNYLQACLDAAGSDDNTQHFVAQLQQVLQGKLGTFSMEYPCDSPAEQQWFHVHVIRFPDEGGPLRVLIKHQNITQRKQAELHLQESREQYRQLIEDIGDNFVVITLDANGIIDFSSKGIASVFGLPSEQVNGLCFVEIANWHAGFVEFAFEQIQNMLKQGNGVPPFHMNFTRLDGSTGTIQITAHPIRCHDGTYRKIHGIVEDITERVRAEKRLRANEEILRSLYELSPIGIALTDIEGHFVEFNPSFLRICGGYTEKELKSLDYWSLTPREYEAREAAQLEVLQKTGRYGPYEKEYVQKNGQRVPLRLNGVLVTGYDGGSYIWSLVEDISAQKSYELELYTAKEAAEAANHAKSVFLANMSHELRTPLNAILGYAQIMTHQADLPEKYLSYVDGIYKGGQYLLTLINDILDLTKVEAGRFELIREDVNIDTLLNELVNMFRNRAERKHLRFEYHVAQPFPYSLHVDAKRLRQIFINLLGNAVKFTEQGQISLRLSYQHQVLHVCVEDSGIGIDPAQHEEIFKPFAQTGENRYQTQGTGLGLTITRKLLELMDGSITLRSVPGQGSCFTLEIPAPAVFASTPVSTMETAGSQEIIGYRRTDGGNARLRLLIVDDTAANRLILNKLLSALDFDTTEADSGEDCLQKAPEFQPDLVLMDLRMPGLNGLETSQQLHKLSGFEQLPIIAVSASVYQEDRENSQKAGCVDYLSKPVERVLLLEALQKQLPLNWIHADNNQKQVTSNTPEPAAAHSQLNPEQREALLKLVNKGAVSEIRAYLKQLLEQTDCPAEVYDLEKLAQSFKLNDMRQHLSK